MRQLKSILLTALLTVWISPTCLGFELSGTTGLQLYQFAHPSLYEEQYNESSFSIHIAPEFYHDWYDGQQSITFTPFVRLDQHDSNRTHCDIRELYWQVAKTRFEARLGFQQVFWGVTESVHLVDIINQIDSVEDFKQESKLGQPMVDLSLINSGGTWQLFLMPYFRERTFPGEKGRLRTELPVDTDSARYESGDKEQHWDWAIRWFKSVGEFDIGLAFFSGTNREPTLELITDTQGRMVLVPYYDLINQASLDLQWTHNNWLWKVELLQRDSSSDSYWATVFGFEYTFIGVFNSPFDIGLLSEYLYDQRGLNMQTPFENDLYIGSRIVLNDVKMTEILIGTIIDINSGENIIQGEVSRRIGDSFRLNVEGRMISNESSDSPLYGIRDDDLISVTLNYYF
jgi:hypothetical protein